MTAAPLRLKPVAASQGVQWVRLGFQVFARRPLAFTALFAGFLFLAMVSALLPFIGILLPLVAMPLLTLGFMLATRSALQNQAPTPALFIVPLKSDPKRRNVLLRIGLAYAVATLGIVLLSGWVDDGAFAAAQTALLDDKASAQDVEAALAEPRLIWGIVLRLGLTLLLALPFWHAPALAWWGGQGVGQSLFSSSLACWRARGAFTAYLLSWVVVLALFALLLALVSGLLGGRNMVGIAALPAGLMFSTVFYASLYFSFVDCFDQTPSEAPAADGISAA